MTLRPYDRVLAKLGNQATLVEVSGCSQSTVSYWAHSGLIPAKHQSKILTSAKAKGIDLEPADFFSEGAAA